MTYTDDRVAAETGLTDRVALLQSAMHKLGVDVIRLQTQVTQFMAAAPPAAPARPAAQERPAAARFIFTLSREDYRGELAALVAWVHDFLIPVYLGPDPDWCPAWWEHHEAVGRLHALRLSYLELTDTAAAGPSGPGVWHRDHLDPALDRLRADAGPFARCLGQAGHHTGQHAG